MNDFRPFVFVVSVFVVGSMLTFLGFPNVTNAEAMAKPVTRKNQILFEISSPRPGGDREPYFTRLSGRSVGFIAGGQSY